MKRSKILASAFVLVLVSALAAWATPVGPGETVGLGQAQFTTPLGDIIADNTRPITLTYIPPAGFTFPSVEEPVQPGTLRTQVVRDPATRKLTFVYEFNKDPGVGGTTPGLEGGSLKLASFDSFTTDFTADREFGTLSRSADGKTITDAFGGKGQGGLGRYAIATDATSFNSNGTFDLEAVNEFRIFEIADESNGQNALITAHVNLTGVFQPAAAQPPSAIPLPPAVWSGLSTLLVIGACGALRHRFPKLASV